MLHHIVLRLTTEGRKMLPITQQAQALIDQHDTQTGICHLFCQHTSASIVLCENADPDVKIDLEIFFQQLVPDGDNRFLHHAEGPDDMPAHIRTLLTQSALSIPYQNGQLLLGTWQGIYLYEHRMQSHARQVVVTLLA